MKFSDDQNIAELVADIKSKRLIPFIGAGFSKFCGLPSWLELLEILAQKFSKEHGLSKSDILRFSNNDPLKIAEFLYMINDEKIGPIRRAIEREFSRWDADVLRSDPHISIVNLNLPIIYTTNFDDLLERTYDELGLNYKKICTTSDLFQSHNEETQIVKFHGDLEHEETLVFTETSYYQRLNLESAIDIKFRSDLLGKSVLFLGYGFNDINIRIIWFKLRHLMADLNKEAASKSYIVTLEDNPILNKLYQKAGIKTICLTSTKNYKEAYTEFLQYLVNEVNVHKFDVTFKKSIKKAIKNFFTQPFKPYIPANTIAYLVERLDTIENNNLSETQLMKLNDEMDKSLDNYNHYEFYSGKRKEDLIVFCKLLFSSKFFPLKGKFYDWLYNEYIYNRQYSLPLFEVMILALLRYDFAWAIEEKEEKRPDYWFLRHKMIKAFSSFPHLLYKQILIDAEKWIIQNEHSPIQRKTLTYFEVLKQCNVPFELVESETKKQLNKIIQLYEAKVPELCDWDNILKNGLDREIVYGKFKMDNSSDKFVWDYPKELIERLYIDGEEAYSAVQPDDEENDSR